MAPASPGFLGGQLSAFRRGFPLPGKDEHSLEVHGDAIALLLEDQFPPLSPQ